MFHHRSAPQHIVLVGESCPTEHQTRGVFPPVIHVLLPRQRHIVHGINIREARAQARDIHGASEMGTLRLFILVPSGFLTTALLNVR